MAGSEDLRAPDRRQGEGRETGRHGLRAGRGDPARSAAQRGKPPFLARSRTVVGDKLTQFINGGGARPLSEHNIIDGRISRSSLHARPSTREAVDCPVGGRMSVTSAIQNLSGKGVPAVLLGDCAVSSWQGAETIRGPTCAAPADGWESPQCGGVLRTRHPPGSPKTARPGPRHHAAT